MHFSREKDLGTSVQICNGQNSLLRNSFSPAPGGDLCKRLVVVVLPRAGLRDESTEMQNPYGWNTEKRLSGKQLQYGLYEHDRKV
jgi:hypothetical protein